MEEEVLLPGQLYKREEELRQIFLGNIKLIPEGERIKQCIQCGTCTGSCPVSYKMEITPRQIISYFRAGEISKILQSNSIWLCISCYSCQTRCPALIKITDIIYALKQTALRKNIYSKKFLVHPLRDTFINMMKKYGRLNELWLMVNYFLKTNPLRGLSYLKLAFNLLKRKRYALVKSQIKNVDALREIINQSTKYKLPVEVYKPSYKEDVVGYKAVG